MVIHMLWNLFQQIFKIIIRFRIVCLCRFSNAVDDGICFRTCDCINHHPVLFADTKWTDCLFCYIVVKRDFAIIQKCSEIASLMDGIRKSICCFTLRWDFQQVLFYPREINIDQWFHCQLPMVRPFLRIHSGQLIILPVNRPYLRKCQICK